MRVGLLVLVLSMIVTAGSFAGVCTRSAEFYLECLEGKHPANRECQSASICFDCAGVPMKQQKRWGNRSERKHLLSMRDLPYRDRLVSLAQKYLSDPQARDTAIEVLAFQGISKIDDVDVFEEITKRKNFEYVLWYTLAALQDPRTISFAEDRYMSILRSADKIDAYLRDSLMDIIDCLYHFRSAESRALLRRLAESETDADLRKYIVRTTGI